MKLEQDPRLARRIGTGSAVCIGLAAMLPGIFVAIGPAATRIGWLLPVPLLAAAGVAYCNATSSAQLAAVHPRSGGTYVYASERLGPFWGYMAGWAFLSGKVVSSGAVALGVGAHLAPGRPRLAALAALAVATAANLSGVRVTARASVVAALVLVAALTTAVLAGLTHPGPVSEDLSPVRLDPLAALQATGLLFFAFTGYARVATLGEEVVDPSRTIPRAIPLALGMVLVLYIAVVASALLSLGPDALGSTEAPLLALADPLPGGTGIVRAGIVTGGLGLLVSTLAGMSRTAFAMARAGQLPTALYQVHTTRLVPHRAELLLAGVTGVLVATLDIAEAVGYGAFLTLVYYGITNASAWTLPPELRRWPRPLTVIGGVACGLLALSLPAASTLWGLLVFAAGAALWALLHRHPRPTPLTPGELP